MYLHRVISVFLVNTLAFGVDNIPKVMISRPPIITYYVFKKPIEETLSNELGVSYDR